MQGQGEYSDTRTRPINTRDHKIGVKENLMTRNKTSEIE